MFGIDGCEVRENDFIVESSRRAIIYLTTAWSVERRFDAVLCLEVAEHLNEAKAAPLLAALIAHTDYCRVLRSGSAANNPVNCQWPRIGRRSSTRSSSPATMKFAGAFRTMIESSLGIARISLIARLILRYPDSSRDLDGLFAGVRSTDTLSAVEQEYLHWQSYFFVLHSRFFVRPCVASQER